NVRVFTAPVEGGPPTCLSGDLDRSCNALGAPPLWSSDGAWITAGAEDRGDVGLYRFLAKGGTVPKRVVGGERVVTGASLSADGRWLAFAATDPVMPAEVFVTGSNGSGERRLTDLNRDWRSEVALARPERFTFERAGFPIDVWVMRPHGFRPDAKS